MKGSLSGRLGGLAGLLEKVDAGKLSLLVVSDRPNRATDYRFKIGYVEAVASAAPAARRKSRLDSPS